MYFNKSYLLIFFFIFFLILIYKFRYKKIEFLVEFKKDSEIKKMLSVKHKVQKKVYILVTKKSIILPSNSRCNLLNNVRNYNLNLGNCVKCYQNQEIVIYNSRSNWPPIFSDKRTEIYHIILNYYYDMDENTIEEIKKWYSKNTKLGFIAVQPQTTKKFRVPFKGTLNFINENSKTPTSSFQLNIY